MKIKIKNSSNRKIMVLLEINHFGKINNRNDRIFS